MKVSEILKKIDAFAPFSLAYEWDNVGLLCGDENAEVTGICVCLDASKEAIQRAIDEKCNLIVTHHPFIYNKLGAIDYNSYFGQMVTSLIKNNICLISAHTNIDKAQNGINQRLAKRLSLMDIKILEEDEQNNGLGRMGTLEKETTLFEFAEKVKKTLKTPVRIVGDREKRIKTVAVGGGSCIEIADIAKEKGCDVLVTGDVKYHQAQDLVRDGLCIVDAGHYATEICVLDIFEEIFCDCKVKIVKEENKDVFEII